MSYAEHIALTLSPPKSLKCPPALEEAIKNYSQASGNTRDIKKVFKTMGLRIRALTVVRKFAESARTVIWVQSKKTGRHAILCLMQGKLTWYCRKYVVTVCTRESIKARVFMAIQGEYVLFEPDGRKLGESLESTRGWVAERTAYRYWNALTQYKEVKDFI